MKVCSACAQENPAVANFCFACGAPLEAPALVRAELERARAIFVRIGATTQRDAIDRELAELVEGPAPPGPSRV